MLAPYLIGVVTAPLVARVLKPMLRGAVKTSVGVALEVRKAAAEAGEEIQDIAAEVNVEKVAADKADRPAADRPAADRPDRPDRPAVDRPATR